MREFIAVLLSSPLLLQKAAMSLRNSRLISLISSGCRGVATFEYPTSQNTHNRMRLFPLYHLQYSSNRPLSLRQIGPLHTMLRKGSRKTSLYGTLTLGVRLVLLFSMRDRLVLNRVPICGTSEALRLHSAQVETQKLDCIQPLGYAGS